MREKRGREKRDNGDKTGGEGTEKQREREGDRRKEGDKAVKGRSESQ